MVFYFIPLGFYFDILRLFLDDYFLREKIEEQENCRSWSTLRCTDHRMHSIVLVMVKIEKRGDYFLFEVKGIHKLWAFKSQLTIPVEHVANAYPNQESVNWIAGLRMPGTHIPGLITAGSYVERNGTIFYDVSDPKKSIVIELIDEHYKKLIIEVENVEAAIKLLSEK